MTIQDDANLAHPWWCDPRQCGRSGPVQCHLSAPHWVIGKNAGDVLISARLSSVIDEPLEVAPVSIELAMRDPVTGNAGKYLLDRGLVPRFYTQIGALMPMVR
jgi:hypothetical protein